MEIKSFHELKAGDLVDAYGTRMRVLKDAYQETVIQGGRRTVVRWQEEPETPGDFSTYSFPWDSGFCVDLPRPMHIVTE